VNKRGYLETQMSFLKADLSRWKRIFETNIFGRMTVQAKRFSTWQSAKTARAASMLTLSSLASVYGSPNEYVDYAASKRGGRLFSKGFCIERRK